MKPLPIEELSRIGALLGGPGIDVVSHGSCETRPMAGSGDAREQICSTLARRPSTVEDLVRLTGIAGGEVAKLLGELEREGLIVHQRGPRGLFYALARTGSSPNRTG